jgi:hypothetical protein
MQVDMMDTRTLLDVRNSRLAGQRQQARPRHLTAAAPVSGMPVTDMAGTMESRVASKVVARRW